MKKLLLLLVLFAPFIAAAQSQSTSRETANLVWYSDLTEANKISQSSKKPIFAFFTGSDWCGWCHRLQREVFAKPDFIEWAKKNVVLLELDFPRNKPQPAELVQQNQSLQQQFQVRGYPTVWMFFASKAAGGNPVSLNALGSLGYPSGATRGKEEVKFLEEANRILSLAKAK